MLFDSSIRRELWRGFVGTLAVLLTVVLTTLLIRVLGQATKGMVGVTDVSLLLGYTVIAQMPPLVSLSLFIAVVSVLSRLQRDSEMVVWQSAGVGLQRWFKPIGQMSFPVLALLALLVLVARPWGQQQMDRLRESYEQRSDIARVAPGQFQTSADGRKVFFIDSRSDGERVGNNVFIVLKDPDGETVVTARQGTLSTDQGLRYLDLVDGERIQTRTSSGEKTRARFHNARMLVGDAPSSASGDLAARAMGTLALLKTTDLESRAELVWRGGFIWAAFNFTLIALASVNTRVRRANVWSMLWALLVFVVYFNLLTLSQVWVATSKVSEQAGLFGLHGSITVLALAVLWWRDGGLDNRRIPAGVPE